MIIFFRGLKLKAQIQEPAPVCGLSARPVLGPVALLEWVGKGILAPVLDVPRMGGPFPAD